MFTDREQKKIMNKGYCLCMVNCGDELYHWCQVKPDEYDMNDPI